jgi:hypothetical protein
MTDHGTESLATNNSFPSYSYPLLNLTLASLYKNLCCFDQIFSSIPSLTHTNFKRKKYTHQPLE